MVGNRNRGTLSNVKRDVSNSYPAAIMALRLSDGKSMFGAGPQGETMGPPAFFDNGDFTSLGDEMVARYDGHTGKPICKIAPVQAYNTVTLLATSGDYFFSTFFGFGWKNQYVVKSKCA